MLLLKFIILLEILVNIKHTDSIINNKLGGSFNQLNEVNYKTLQAGTFYLNHQHPLWILQDVKPQELTTPQTIYNKPMYENIKPIYFRSTTMRPNLNNHQRFHTNAQKRITFFNNKQHLELPKDYLSNFKLKRTIYVPPFKRMPTFDAMPGEESFESNKPLFIYTGQKGRMLFNTMLSNYKYPMQEPVPGQTLYPPQSLIMETPAKSRETSYSTATNLNVTLIPFYAYEAIDPRMINQRNNNHVTPNSQLIETMTRDLRNLKRHKKPKKYSAFYTPQEVLAHSQYDSTTSFPLTLQKPYANHKFENVEATTSMAHKKLEVTYNDGEDKFRITYEDENPSANLERPTEVTTPAPQIFNTYEQPSSYYTQTLYSVGNQDVNQEEEISKNDIENRETQENERATKEATKDHGTSENTWFILNARYKGPFKSNLKNLHSSKYIQTTTATEDDLDFLKTTATTTTTSNAAKKKKKLRPQMRALYGNNFEIVL